MATSSVETNVSGRYDSYLRKKLLDLQKKIPESYVPDVKDFEKII